MISKSTLMICKYILGEKYDNCSSFSNIAFRANEIILSAKKKEDTLNTSSLLLDWQLVSEKRLCTDKNHGVYNGRAKYVWECADLCRQKNRLRKGSYFAIGRDEDNSLGCWANRRLGCECFCYTWTEVGECNEHYSAYHDLYWFA